MILMAHVTLEIQKLLILLSKMKKITFSLFGATFMAFQFSFASPVCAADLSNGMKNLRLGITKDEVLKVLKIVDDKFFSFSCAPNKLGEMCSTFYSNFTYGNIQVVKWVTNFAQDNRLENVSFLLSVEGCNNTEALHPRLQFEKLSTLLNQQYGNPTSHS